MERIGPLLRRGMTAIAEKQLKQGNPVPVDRVPNLIDSIDHIPCSNCGEPVLDRSPNPHLATALIECKENER